MAAKKDNQAQLLAVLMVLLVILGIVFKDRVFKPKSRSQNTTRQTTQGGSAPGGSSEGGGGTQISVTPDMIPQLSPEIKRKIKEKRGTDATIYPKEKLEAGINPFIPYDKDPEELDRKRDRDDGSGSAHSSKKKKVPVFSKRLIFWGAFSPGQDEAKRAIVEVVGDAQPWTGVVGEMIEGTPYRLAKIGDGDLFVELENPSNRKDLVRLRFEGLKEEPGRDKGASTQKEIDSLFGPRKKEEDGGSSSAPTASPRDISPAFDR